MWCTEVAAGAFLTFRNVVSGDIGDHGRYPTELTANSRTQHEQTAEVNSYQS
jgi:hypothetical protein